MRHRLAHRKLNRPTAARNSLLQGLATQLIEHEAIVTTLEKAKELRSFVEPLVTIAKVDSVFNRRRLSATLYSKSAVGKLFKDIAPANQSRPGGYTRLLRLSTRPGDNARRVMIEFVSHSKSTVKKATSADVNPATTSQNSVLEQPATV